MPDRCGPLVRLTAALLASAALALAPTPALAQGSHYWTNQYGNRSMLLSGVVVGGVQDLGAVYYNPGRLAQIENPAFILTAKAYQWDKLSIKDALGEGVDLRDSNWGGAPSLVAGTFKVPFLEGHSFAYSFLTRNSGGTDLFLRAEDLGDLSANYPGEEYFLGVFDGAVAFKDEWIGLTWAHAFTPRIAFGVSTFYYAERRNSDFNLDLRILSEEGETAVLDRDRAFAFRSQGLIGKAGLSVKVDPFTLGLSLTTPRWQVTGSGSIKYDDFLANVVSAEGPLEDLLTSSVQRGLPIRLHSPWAVGGGLSWSMGRLSLYGAGEWYAGVDRYAVITPEPFAGQSTGDTIRYTISQELEPVFNYGVGVAWNRSENFQAYGSLATNLSAAPDETVHILDFRDDVDVNTSHTDFPQAGFGFAWNSPWADLTLGLTYAWSDEVLPRPVDLPQGLPGRPVIGGDETALWRISRWRFLFGLSIPFADQLKERAKGATEGS